jgi:uncharacterized protein
MRLADYTWQPLVHNTYNWNYRSEILETVMRNDQDLNSRDRTEIEAAVYRRLIDHLRAHPQVQNIDLMNLADFCRNCLSKWYRAAAEERGIAIDDERSRELVYGMPYSEYKQRYQKEATPAQRAAFEARQGDKV